MSDLGMCKVCHADISARWWECRLDGCPERSPAEMKKQAAPLVDKQKRQRARVAEILQRHIPDDESLSDDALARATFASYDHWRHQPLIDPNE